MTRLVTQIVQHCVNSLNIAMVFEVGRAKWQLLKAVPKKYWATDKGGELSASVSIPGLAGNTSFNLPRRLLPKDLQELVPPSFLTKEQKEQADESLYLTNHFELDQSALNASNPVSRHLSSSVDGTGTEVPLAYAAKRYRFLVLVCQPIQDTQGKSLSQPINPFESRDRFLRLRCSGERWREELLGFLNEVGPWDRTSILTTGSSAGRLSIVLLEQIWEDQRAIEEGMRKRNAAREWLTQRKNLPVMQYGPGPLVLQGRYRFARDALRMAVTIDHLHEVQFSICANNTCKLPFKPTRRDQIFCARTCAAASGQRQRREKFAKGAVTMA